MSESPFKRRKTSPTTSIAIPAPNPQTRNAPTPSFASPTRASAAKRDANLASRGLSPNKGRDAPIVAGKKLNDLFAKALGEVQPSIEKQDGGSKSGRAIGGSFAVQPRRMSRSPSKHVSVERTTAPPVDTTGIANPFQKKGLRRSPISSQAESVVPNSQPVDGDINPFQKRGLRRSPTGSQPPQSVPSPQPFQPLVVTRTVETRDAEQSTLEPGRAAEPFSTTPPGLPPSRTIQDNLMATQDIAARTLQAMENTLAIPSAKAPVTRPEPLFELNVPEIIAPPSLEAVTQAPSVQTEPVTVEQGDVENPKDVNEEASKESESVVLPKNDEIRLPAVDKVSHTKDKSPAVVKPSPRSTRQTRLPATSAREEELDLPPTPTQRGLEDPVVTTPPSGIHNTPSKRERARLRKALKSSPLKPRDERPEQSQNDPILKDGIVSEQVIRGNEELEPRSALKKLDGNSSVKAQKRRSARFLVPEDPHADKKKEREKLEKELRLLQEDIETGKQEAERLRLLHNTPSRTSSQAPIPKDSEKLLAMLNRSISETKSQPKQTIRAKSIFASIDAFLPFHSRYKPAKTLDPALQRSIEKPLPSFDPIHQTDPLPFLQAFAPLHYTQTITLLPSSPGNSSSSELPQLQEHLITASHPSQLFHTRLSLIVNTSNYSIHALDVLQLDPAAKSELGPFLQGKAAAKEISVIGWAMGRWVEVAITRAKFWGNTTSEFSNHESRRKAIEAYKARSNKRKRGSDNIVTNDDSVHEQEQKWSRRELLPHMGRTSYEISSKNVTLRIEWKVGFDWTGEVESHIDAFVAVPTHWKTQDDRNSLATIQSTFRKLVKQKGPIHAVRCIVALLFDDNDDDDES